MRLTPKMMTLLIILGLEKVQAKLNSWRLFCMTVSLTAQNTSRMFSESVEQKDDIADKVQVRLSRVQI